MNKLNNLIIKLNSKLIGMTINLVGFLHKSILTCEGLLKHNNDYKIMYI